MLSAGAIAGIVIGSVAGVVIFTYLLRSLLLRRQRAQYDHHTPHPSLHIAPVPPIEWPSPYAVGSGDSFWPQSELVPDDSVSAVAETYQSGFDLVNQGSMQVKGIREVRGDRELGSGAVGGVG